MNSHLRWRSGGKKARKPPSSTFAQVQIRTTIQARRRLESSITNDANHPTRRSSMCRRYEVVHGVSEQRGCSPPVNVEAMWKLDGPFVLANSTPTRMVWSNAPFLAWSNPSEGFDPCSFPSSTRVQHAPVNHPSTAFQHSLAINSVPQAKGVLLLCFPRNPSCSTMQRSMCWTSDCMQGCLGESLVYRVASMLQCKLRTATPFLTTLPLARGPACSHKSVHPLRPCFPRFSFPRARACLGCLCLFDSRVGLHPPVVWMVDEKRTKILPPNQFFVHFFFLLSGSGGWTRAHVWRWRSRSCRRTRTWSTCTVVGRMEKKHVHVCFV